MTAPELSAEEAARVAEFDAAPDAPESLRERVAATIWFSGFGFRAPWSELSEITREKFRGRADAVLDVVRGV